MDDPARLNLSRRAVAGAALSLALAGRVGAAATPESTPESTGASTGTSTGASTGASGGAGPAPLVVAGARMAVELGPIHLAVRKLYGEGASIVHGGVVDLVGSDHKADVGSNGETQMMRHSRQAPDMRAIMTVAEGHYSLVARRSAGIATIADLKGKRILGYPATTAGYFLHKMLATANLTFADVTVMEVPLGKVGSVTANREVDAVAIWEPDGEQALRALRAAGEDVVIFSGNHIYHERYNLCTTAGALADPTKRRQIVALMRAIIEATDQINHDPVVAARAQALVARSGGLYTAAEVAAGWPNVKYVANFDDRLLDLFVEEDIWLAAQEKRPPRSREELAPLVDRSAYDEARRKAS